MKPVFRWTVGNCTNQGIEILCESIRRAVQVYEDKFNWYVCYNNLTAKQLAAVSTVANKYKVTMRESNSLCLPIPQTDMGSPRSNDEFDWDGANVGGTLWKICPPRIQYSVHEIIMDNDIVFTEKLPEIDEFLDSSKCLILQDNVRFYGMFASRVESEVPLNTGLIGLPPDYFFEDSISELFHQFTYAHPSYNFGRLSQADEQGMIAAVISQEDHIVISNKVVVELLGRASEQCLSGRGGAGTTKKHLSSYVRFCESIFSPTRKAYHFCQANRLETHFAWELYKKFQTSGASILADFRNKEVERIARRGYVEGGLGSIGLAKNWSQTYAERRLAMAKSELYD